MTPSLPDGPLASGAPYWYWLGARPALDFVNTRRERWRRDVECLVTPRDLARWLAAARVLDTEPAADPAALPEARALREAIDGAVRALVAGERVPPAAVARVDGWLGDARPRPCLEMASGVPVLTERLDPTVHHGLALVALDAAHLLGSPEQRARVRICASATCSARFYDRSPAGRRRWCSMGACGNVEKARRHRSRRSERV